MLLQMSLYLTLTMMYILLVVKLERGMESKDDKRASVSYERYCHKNSRKPQYMFGCSSVVNTSLS